jgi:hypothetical protein
MPCKDKESRAATNQRQRAKHLAEGMCGRCGKNIPEPGFITCPDCLKKGRERYVDSRDQEGGRERNNRLVRERSYLLRQAVLAHYGGQCACCGEAQEVFLTVDHIGGGGNEHRRQINGTHRSATFYRWLKNNNYPPGYQVLCCNCNYAKHRDGRCPHEVARNPWGRLA